MLLNFFSSCATTIFSDFEMKKVSYTSFDGHKLTSDLYLPRKLKPLNPVVIVIHGGGWRSRSGDMSSICKRLVNEGYVALNITYRLAPKHTHPIQEQDVKASLKWINENQNQFKLNPERIYVWGYSAGAHLALNLANEKDVKIKAAVVGGTPSNLAAYPKSGMIEDFVGEKFADNPEKWKKASPINHVHAQTPPAFIYHGEHDLIVGVDQSEKLSEKFKEFNIPHEFYRISYLGHVGVYFMSSEAVKRGIDFIARYP